MKEEAITSALSYAGTAKGQLTIRWSCLPTFFSTLSHAIGTECGNKTLWREENEYEIREEKEHMPPPVQTSTQMTIYQQKDIRYPGYMEKLWIICQGGNICR